MQGKYPPRKSWKSHKADCYCNRCFKHKCSNKKPAQLDYFSYIKSPQWQQRKDQYYLTHKKHCNACGITKGIELHHLDYQSLGKERDIDLVPLCEACHKDFHAKNSIQNLRQATYAYISQKQQAIRLLIKNTML